MGESQGVPKWLSPNEEIQNSKFKTNSTENQAKKRGQKPGCHKPPPLRMNLVLEIRLLGNTTLVEDIDLRVTRQEGPDYS